MRFYQVKLFRDGGVSIGSEWVRTKTKAYRVKREHREARSDADKAMNASEAEIVTVDIVPTRAGILDALNQYAGHPDNG